MQTVTHEQRREQLKKATGAQLYRLGFAYRELDAKGVETEVPLFPYEAAVKTQREELRGILLEHEVSRSAYGLPLRDLNTMEPTDAVLEMTDMPTRTRRPAPPPPDEATKAPAAKTPPPGFVTPAIGGAKTTAAAATAPAAAKKFGFGMRTAAAPATTPAPAQARTPVAAPEPEETEGDAGEADVEISGADLTPVLHGLETLDGQIRGIAASQDELKSFVKNETDVILLAIGKLVQQVLVSTDSRMVNEKGETTPDAAEFLKQFNDPEQVRTWAKSDEVVPS